LSKNKALLNSKFGRLAEIWPQLLLAFSFPMLTVLAALVITGCYPFGDRTMLTVDLYHQYAPFVVTFRNKLLSGDSLLYSWNDGLGQEFYAAYANYAASPLNLFAVFFTAKTIPVFIGFVTCLRAGLSGLFMMFFLAENDNNRVDNITVVFACSYALCGWYIAYFWNIMVRRSRTAPSGNAGTSKAPDRAQMRILCRHPGIAHFLQLLCRLLCLPVPCNVCSRLLCNALHTRKAQGRSHETVLQDIYRSSFKIRIFERCSSRCHGDPYDPNLPYPSELFRNRRYFPQGFHTSEQSV
jgi:hypothetical protein